MRAVRVLALILWIGAATYLWFRISPLAPDAVIRSSPLGSEICIISNEMLATYPTVEVDGYSEGTGPISWYDRRTGRVIKTVFSEHRCEIDGVYVAERPPIADLIVHNEHVVADLWSGRILARLPMNVDERPYEASPDGRYLAWMDAGNVRVIETATLKLVLKRPAVTLLGFHGNETVGIRVREVDASDGDRSRSVALSLPDGAVADISSPISKTAILSSQGDLLLKRVDEFQAAVCDPRTGAVIWQTQIPFPGPPDSIRSDMYRFNAAGDELLAVYGDDQSRPRFAKWRSKDGQVLSPLPMKLGPPMKVHGVDFDPATGAMTTNSITMSPYDNYEGAIASSDGRYVVEPYESEWEQIAWEIYAKLDELESTSDLFESLQLSALFDISPEIPLQAVVDATTGERVGTVGAGNVRTPSDASWFAVQDQSSIRLYSAPFRADWLSLVIWAFVPPIALLVVTRLVRFAVSRWRTRRVIATGRAAIVSAG